MFTKMMKSIHKLIIIICLRINFPLMSNKCIKYLLNYQTITIVKKSHKIRIRKIKFHGFLSKYFSIEYIHYILDSKKLKFSVNGIDYELKNDEIVAEKNTKYLTSKYLYNFDWYEINTFIKLCEHKIEEQENFNKFLNRNQELIENEFERLSTTSNIQITRVSNGLHISGTVDHNNIEEFITDLKIVSDSLAYNNITLEFQLYSLLNDLSLVDLIKTSYNKKLQFNSIPDILTFQFRFYDYTFFKQYIGMDLNMDLDNIKIRILSATDNRNSEYSQIHDIIMMNKINLSVKEFLNMTRTYKTMRFNFSK